MNAHPQARVAESPEKMELIRLCALRGALRLELKGLKRSRSPSAYMLVKRQFGWRGSRERILTRLCEHIEKHKQLYGLS